MKDPELESSVKRSDSADELATVSSSRPRSNRLRVGLWTAAATVAVTVLAVVVRTSSTPRQLVAIAPGSSPAPDVSTSVPTVAMPSGPTLVDGPLTADTPLRRLVVDHATALDALESGFSLSDAFFRSDASLVLVDQANHLAVFVDSNGDQTGSVGLPDTGSGARPVLGPNDVLYLSSYGPFRAIEPNGTAPPAVPQMQVEAVALVGEQAGTVIGQWRFDTWDATSNKSTPEFLLTANGLRLGADGVVPFAVPLGGSPVPLSSVAHRAEFVMDPSVVVDPTATAMPRITGQIVDPASGQSWLLDVEDLTEPADHPISTRGDAVVQPSGAVLTPIYQQRAGDNTAPTRQALMIFNFDGSTSALELPVEGAYAAISAEGDGFLALGVFDGNYSLVHLRLA